MLHIEVFEETLLLAEQTAGMIRQAAAGAGLPVASLTSGSRYVCENTGGNLCVIGATKRPARPELALARAIRELRAWAHIVFILNGAEDIGYCVTPAVRPSALLRRPPAQVELRRILTGVYADLRAQADDSEGEGFRLKTGGGSYRVAAHQISFFESRGRKIAMKTQTQEITFYANMGEVLSGLPDYFLRCHKGYIVNTRRVTAVKVAAMVLILDDGCAIPFSRSYREAVRALAAWQGEFTQDFTQESVARGDIVQEDAAHGGAAQEDFAHRSAGQRGFADG
jgi:DNA-binding LytR/AlgR family response regulator